LLAPHPTPKLEDQPLLAVRDYLFSIFAAALQNWRASPPSATWVCGMPHSVLLILFYFHHLFSKEVLHILWNMKVYCCVHSTIFFHQYLSFELSVHCSWQCGQVVWTSADIWEVVGSKLFILTEVCCGFSQFISANVGLGYKKYSAMACMSFPVYSSQSSSHLINNMCSWKKKCCWILLRNNS
jgi:hypothetical protein